MNLKFVWSELHLISVRSQDVLAFATAVEAFVNTARRLFNVNNLFIFLAFDARGIEKLHRKNFSGSRNQQFFIIQRKMITSLIG